VGIMVNQLNRTIDVIEEAIDELIEMRDNWFPVGSGFSDELSDFAEEELSNVIDRIMNKKRWKDTIGQSI
tara:strand:+ start:265 stop:474 length:210 start_codon:yes stop_codon:yes gene_type:complete